MRRKRRTIAKELVTSIFLALIIPYLVVAIGGAAYLRHQIRHQNDRQVSAAMETAYSLLLNEMSLIQSTVVGMAKDAHLLSLIRQPAGLEAETGFPGNIEPLHGARIVNTGEHPVYPPRPLFQNEYDNLIDQALAEGKPIAEFRHLETRELALYDFRVAPPKGRETVLAIQAVAPINSEEGEPLGAISGIVILNGNRALLQRISFPIFHEYLMKQGDIGMIALSVQGRRVASNLIEALGSRETVSPEVDVMPDGEGITEEHILDERLFLTGLRPLLDSERQTVGMLEVGIPETALIAYPRTPVFIFTGIILLTLGVAYLLSRHHNRLIVDPITDMALTARAIAGGDHNLELTVPSTREIADLAESFNEVARQYRDLVEGLEATVAERSEKIESMQRQLMQADRLASVGKLAAGVAHEINNPLTSILTNASLMAESCPPENPYRRDLELIVGECLRCRKIVRGLLNFSRQSPPEFSSFSLNNAVDQTIRLLRHQLRSRKIGHEIDLDPNLARICADPDQIQQVLLNLFMNSMDAMPEGGLLTVVTQSLQSHAILQISDTGVGIPDSIIDHIFDPFFTTKESGTGLGLSISYGIIQAHGGKISVESKENQGTIFSLYFPLPSQNHPSPCS
ncbi:MAG TPA: ATP-binding protein [Thermoanaerobaculia bacterium]|nr:ATP-binding protein [Thermoanaerobaculia bacterium]HUM29141.1 ATP-binding protein [Thermoanaerobaculia bacterium]HXK67518.1 ATP-binding protein [Thermoanaerobaculia bacterium]